MGQHFAGHDLSVNQITLNPNVDVSLPPFADALRLLERRQAFNPLEVDDAAMEASLDDEDVEDEGAVGTFSVKWRLPHAL